MPTDSKEDDILQTQHIYELLCDWIEGNTPAPFRHLDLPDMLFLFSPYPSQVQTRQVDKVKIYSEDHFDKLLTRLPSNQRLHIFAFKLKRVTTKKILHLLLQSEKDSFLPLVFIVKEYHSDTTSSQILPSSCMQIREHRKHLIYLLHLGLVPRFQNRSTVTHHNTSAHNTKPRKNPSQMLVALVLSLEPNPHISVEWTHSDNNYRQTWVANKDILSERILAELSSLPAALRVDIKNRPPCFTKLATPDCTSVAITLDAKSLVTLEKGLQSLNNIANSILNKARNHKDYAEFQRICRPFLGHGDLKQEENMHRSCNVFDINSIKQEKRIEIMQFVQSQGLPYHVTSSQHLIIHTNALHIEALRIALLGTQLTLPFGSHENCLCMQFSPQTQTHHIVSIVKPGEITVDYYQIEANDDLLLDSFTPSPNFEQVLKSRYHASDIRVSIITEEDGANCKVITFAAPSQLLLLPVEFQYQESNYVINFKLPSATLARSFLPVKVVERARDHFDQVKLQGSGMQARLACPMPLEHNRHSENRVQQLKTRFLQVKGEAVLCYIADEWCPIIILTQAISVDLLQVLLPLTVADPDGLSHDIVLRNSDHITWSYDQYAPQDDIDSIVQARLQAGHTFTIKMPRLEQGYVKYSSCEAFEIVAPQNTDIIIVARPQVDVLNILDNSDRVHIVATGHCDIPNRSSKSSSQVIQEKATSDLESNGLRSLTHNSSRHGERSPQANTSADCNMSPRASHNVPEEEDAIMNSPVRNHHLATSNNENIVSCVTPTVPFTIVEGKRPSTIQPSTAVPNPKALLDAQTNVTVNVSSPDLIIDTVPTPIAPCRTAADNAHDHPINQDTKADLTTNLASHALEVKPTTLASSSSHNIHDNKPADYLSKQGLLAMQQGIKHRQLLDFARSDPILRDCEELSALVPLALEHLNATRLNQSPFSTIMRILAIDRDTVGSSLHIREIILQAISKGWTPTKHPRTDPLQKNHFAFALSTLNGINPDHSQPWEEMLEIVVEALPEEQIDLYTCEFQLSCPKCTRSTISSSPILQFTLTDADYIAPDNLMVALQRAKPHINSHWHSCQNNTCDSKHFIAHVERRAVPLIVKLPSSTTLTADNDILNYFTGQQVRIGKQDYCLRAILIQEATSSVLYLIEPKQTRGRCKIVCYHPYLGQLDWHNFVSKHKIHQDRIISFVFSNPIPIDAAKFIQPALSSNEATMHPPPSPATKPKVHATFNLPDCDLTLEPAKPTPSLEPSNVLNDKFPLEDEIQIIEPPKYALISLFDGCGTTLQVVTKQIGHPPSVFLCCEKDTTLRIIVAEQLGLDFDGNWCRSRRGPVSIYLDDVAKLFAEDSKVIREFCGFLLHNQPAPILKVLAIAGSPCTELTWAEINKGILGVTGPNSSLFYYFHLMLWQIRELAPTFDIRFLLENAGSMREVHFQEIKYVLGLPTTVTREELTWKAQNISIAKRDRIFFRNFQDTDADALQENPPLYDSPWGPLLRCDNSIVPAEPFMRPRENINDIMQRLSWTSYHPSSLLWNYDYFGGRTNFARACQIPPKGRFPRLDWSQIIPFYFQDAWKKFILAMQLGSTTDQKDAAIDGILPLLHNPALQMPFRLMTEDELLRTAGLSGYFEQVQASSHLWTAHTKRSAVGNSFHPQLIAAALGTRRQCFAWLSQATPSQKQFPSPLEVQQSYVALCNKLNLEIEAKSIQLKKTMQACPYGSISPCIQQITIPQITVPTNTKLFRPPQYFRKETIENQTKASRDARLTAILPHCELFAKAIELPQLLCNGYPRFLSHNELSTSLLTGASSSIQALDVLIANLKQSPTRPSCLAAIIDLYNYIHKSHGRVAFIVQQGISEPYQFDIVGYDTYCHLGLFKVQGPSLAFNWIIFSPEPQPIPSFKSIPSLVDDVNCFSIVDNKGIPNQELLLCLRNDESLAVLSVTPHHITVTHSRCVLSILSLILTAKLSNFHHRGSPFCHANFQTIPLFSISAELCDATLYLDLTQIELIYASPGHAQPIECSFAIFIPRQGLLKQKMPLVSSTTFTHEHIVDNTQLQNIIHWYTSGFTLTTGHCNRPREPFLLFGVQGELLQQIMFSPTSAQWRAYSSSPCRLRGHFATCLAKELKSNTGVHTNPIVLATFATSTTFEY